MIGLKVCLLHILFIFNTSTFIKYPHQFIYSKHLFNKIFILLHFFIISFALLSRTLSLTASLSHRPNTTQNHQHPTTINNQSTPTINPLSHHQWDQPPSSTHPATIIKQPASIINPPNHHHQATSLQKPKPKEILNWPNQPKHLKPYSTQIPETPFNPNIYEISKPTDQTKNKKGSKPTGSATRDQRGFGEKQRETRFNLRNKGFEKQRL